MSSSMKRVQCQHNVPTTVSLYKLIKRRAQICQKDLINYYDYNENAKAVQTFKLKYRTANESKRKFLIESRQNIEGSMHRHAKYMALLKEKRNQIHYKKSVQILRQCESDGIEPNIVIYSKVMGNCSKCFAPNMVFIKLMQEMITKYKIYPNAVTFSSILNGFYKNEAYLDCIILFGLCQKCITMNFNDLFTNYKKSREISYILQNDILLNAFKQIEINLICANTLLKCIGKMGDMSKVSAFFKAIIAANMMPNDVTLNSMINIFGQNAQLQKMEKMFDWWWSNNGKLLDFSPDIISINSMLAAYAKACEFEKSKALFNAYCSKEHSQHKALLSPTVITFSHIITCCSNCIDAETEPESKLKLKEYAFKYYKMMQVMFGMDDYYNSCTTSLMNVCLKCNDILSLMHVFDERQSKDSKDRQMYNIAFRGLFQHGMIGEALSLFAEGVELKILKYLSASSGPYSMDLHHFDVGSAVIAIMYNLKTLCDTVRTQKDFKVPSIWIVVGKGLHSGSSRNCNNLRDVLPSMLSDERLFYPNLKTMIPHWNEGRIKIDDECLLKYIAHQLKVDSNLLRHKFPSLNTELMLENNSS